LPFSLAFKKHSELAIDGYNSRHEQSQSRLYFNGSGLTWKF
jgi:hypothetical protein